jgi:hypothetical protein
MLYAPLRTVIWEDATSGAWFTADQPSTQFGSFGIPAVSRVGVGLDRERRRFSRHSRWTYQSRCCRADGLPAPSRGRRSS